MVAFVSSAFIPGFTLALGFLLGGIISPPDAVSATTIMRGVKVPKSLVSIIEGESLLNDASSLIVFRFALAAVVTGQFHYQDAVQSFALVIVMGIVIGLLVGLLFYTIHRFLPTTPSIDIVLTLVTPYCMYYFAEHFHFSGVLAVVSGGLFLSNKRQSMLTYQSRIQSVNVWTSIVFVLNGLVFLLIGLQLPNITQQLGNISLGTAIWYGLAISLLLIVTRILCTIGASLFTRFMSNYITVADPNPGFKSPFVLGWAGMRGVVSLAAALSVPLFIHGDEPFPNRNLILFITFIVILVTLVFQGITLPWLIKKLDLKDRFASLSEYEQRLVIQKKIAKASLQFLTDKYGHEQVENQHLGNLIARFRIDLDFFQRDPKDFNDSTGDPLTNYQHIYLELLEEQRNLLYKMNHHAEFDEEVIRNYLSLIDIEEIKLRKKSLNENDLI